ncbi:DUF1707 SHOCT-like domain-containing protein [Rhizohabitans arisaemae]|uniref:DUF1707 SHOCT-like domain-containing protein n=1 Tax=Rhizohabitans arisaemae TaxID=2720610 RepID=UPI0024B27995|nr:DUF1707 domain-containing protein [Rhizohabitans arisaemae]
MEPQARATDDDREKAVQRLQQAFAEGSLGAGEMDERLERALLAKSRSDLHALVSDLGDDVVHLTHGSGSLKRAGDWRVPRALRIDSEYGKVRLDLSRALIRHPEIDIELRLPYGSAVIVLPSGASANTDGVHTQWGRVTCKVADYARPGRLHVNVTGELTYGRLIVRNAHRWFGTRR